MEHTSRPEQILGEMIRVLRPGGLLVIAAPNFGSPLFPSPCSTERYTIRLLRRLLRTHCHLLIPPNGLEWERVTPRTMRDGCYEMDWDTTVEPYIHSLTCYLARKGLECIYATTDLDDVRPAYSQLSLKELLRRPGRTLKDISLRAGHKGVAPYKFFGPNLYYAGIVRKGCCS
jgi:SAM-dependent methyltransferase